MSSLYSMIRAIFFLSATIVAVIFFFANRQAVSLSLFPLPYAFEVPLFVAPAISGGLGLLLGYMLGALPHLGFRRTQIKEIARLKKNLDSLQDENAVLRSQILGQSARNELIAYHEQPESRVLRPAQELFSSAAREG